MVAEANDPNVATNAMDYPDFSRRFGASSRTKNIRPRRWPFLGFRALDHRRFARLPAESGLPDEFIRLCPWELEFLFDVGHRATVGILEIGRAKGGSAFALACANSTVPIYSIDSAPKDDPFLTRALARYGVGNNVTLIVGDSSTRHAQVGPIDLLFVDGDHSYRGCGADIRTWYDAVVPGGALVFHDCYPREGYGVQEAVLELMAEKQDRLEVVVSPLISTSYWRHRHGSLACLRKLSL